MALHRDKGSPPEVSTSGGLRPNRCEAAAPVDGHSLLPGRPLALVASLLPHLGTGTKWLLPSTTIALSYRWGTGQSPSPVDGHSLLPGRSLALVVFIITQMGDRHEVAAPVDGHSAGFGGVGVPQAVATATEGADLRQTQRAVRGFAPVPCSMPALGMVQNKKKAPTPCGAGASLFCWCAIY